MSIIWGGLNSISCIEIQLSKNILDVLNCVFLILVCREIVCSADTQEAMRFGDHEESGSSVLPWVVEASTSCCETREVDVRVGFMPVIV